MMSNQSFEQLSIELDLESEFYIASKSSSGTITVKEGYRKAPYLDINIHQIAQWTDSDGLKIREPEKYERRGNLTGVHLKICLVDNVGIFGIIYTRAVINTNFKNLESSIQYNRWKQV